MKDYPKTAIVGLVSDAIGKQKNMSDEFMIRRTNRIVKIDIQFNERDSFIDENGVKWVKDLSNQK